MDLNRIELERTILGACILQDAYFQIAEVLNPQNFAAVEPYNHRLIFSKIESMYPGRPVDLVSLFHEIKIPHYASYLAQCANSVSSAANLKYHAFILLELSMGDAMINCLSRAADKEVSVTTKAAINEIIDECLDRSNILDIYDKAEEYLKSVGAEEGVLQEIGELSIHYRGRIIKIKSRSHIDCLFRNLENLNKAALDTRSRVCLAHLSEIYKAILIGNPVKEPLFEQIISLKFD
jgi:replicative DNA helicase